MFSCLTYFPTITTTAYEALPQKVQVINLPQTQPAEITATHGAGNVITRAVVGFHDLAATTRAWF